MFKKQYQTCSVNTLNHYFGGGQNHMGNLEIRLKPVIFLKGRCKTQVN